MGPATAISVRSSWLLSEGRHVEDALAEGVRIAGDRSRLGCVEQRGPHLGRAGVGVVVEVERGGSGDKWTREAGAAPKGVLTTGVGTGDADSRSGDVDPRSVVREEGESIVGLSVQAPEGGSQSARKAVGVADRRGSDDLVVYAGVVQLVRRIVAHRCHKRHAVGVECADRLVNK